MADLSALIERVEALTEPSREVDAKIYNALPPKSNAPYLPEYTSSLDAAMALVERVLPGYGLSIERHPVYGDWWDAAIFNQMPRTISNARKQSAPLTLVLATLRALQAKGGE